MKLKNDLSIIHNTDATLTFTNMASNRFKLKKEQYNKMLNDSIRITYKKATDNIHNKNTDGKDLMKDKNLLNRMFTNCKKECFITLKYQKLDLKNKSKVRLIKKNKSWKN